MKNMVKYQHIPVTVAIGQERQFDFEVGENEQPGQFVRISSAEYELVLDKDLSYLRGNMPGDWRQPAIAKLLLILKVNQQQDGKLP